jgi:hypothetical protein
MNIKKFLILNEKEENHIATLMETKEMQIRENSKILERIKEEDEKNLKELKQLNKLIDNSIWQGGN